MAELLWSDPQPQPGRSPNPRGVALMFGPDVTSRFLERNGLELLVRSHQVKEEGYEVEHGGKLVTVFSAPNYCGIMGNKGAALRFDDSLSYTVHQFSASSQQQPAGGMAAMGMGGGMGMGSPWGSPPRAFGGQGYV